MASCKNCGAETRLFNCGAPVCIPCDNKMDKSREDVTHARSESTRELNSREHDYANLQQQINLKD